MNKRDTANNALSIYSHIQPSNQESYVQILGQPLVDS